MLDGDGEHGGRALGRRQRRGRSAAAVAAHAVVEREAVEPRGDELADEWQRVESDAERGVVVLETRAGTSAVARTAAALGDQARRVDSGAVQHRRRKSYTTRTYTAASLQKRPRLLFFE